MIKKLPLFLLALTALTLPATAGGKDWMTDFAAAQAKAKKEKKALLVEFTGSDWCPPCKALNKQILSTSKFLSSAKKNFVLVELDFPQNKKLAANLKKQNDALAKKYKIKGFPTVLLMEPDGKVFGKLGYEPKGVDTFLSKMNRFLKLRKLD